MKKLLLTLIGLGALSGALAQTEKKAPSVSSPPIQRKAKNDQSGTAWFVRTADAPLVFTGQIFPNNVTLDTTGQAEEALNNLRATLQANGSDLDGIARLNVYVTNPDQTPAVDAVIARRFASAPPAVTVVFSSLVKTQARVAFDAIAVGTSSVPMVAGDGASPQPVAAKSRVVIADGVGILPAGGKIFVAGQANPGPGLGDSVKAIMPNLFKALAHVGLGKESIVQIKAFIKPFADQAQAIAEVKASFGELPMPPLVLVEWTTTQPAEIELIASAPDLKRPLEDAAGYVSLPGMPTSPVFSRISTVAAGAPLVFISGIDGGQGGTAREQWKRVFDQLGTVLWDSGSSFRHLVKATYYLHDDKARDEMTGIRGVYYDPTRPPSASALDVPQMPRPGRLVMLDMIAVPVK